MEKPGNPVVCRISALIVNRNIVSSSPKYTGRIFFARNFEVELEFTVISNNKSPGSKYNPA